MKTLFLPAKVKFNINPKQIASLKLPKEIAIAYSIQYQETAQKIKEILSKNHKITLFVQVLGCSKPAFSKETKAVLLVSSGKFHAISLASEVNLPVYLYEEGRLTLISREEIASINRKKQASYLNFLNSNEIGILVSTKNGQENLQKALNFSNKLKRKKSYILIGDNVNPKEFENFGLKSFVNTACPRLDFDSQIINLSTLISANFQATKK